MMLGVPEHANDLQFNLGKLLHNPSQIRTWGFAGKSLSLNPLHTEPRTHPRCQQLLLV